MIKYIRFAVPKDMYRSVQNYISRTEFFVDNPAEENGYVSFTVFGDHADEQMWDNVIHFIENINRINYVSQIRKMEF